MQQSFASCRLCKDTGWLQNDDRLHYCWCEAGIAARAEDRQKDRFNYEVTLSTVQDNFAGVASMRDNWVPEDDEWGDWDKAMKLGLDYIVGSRVLIGKLLRSHRTLLDDAPYDDGHTSQASS